MRSLWALLAALALTFLAGCQGGPSLSGRIAWPKDGDLWVMSLPSKDQQKVTNLPTSEAVSGVAWSPDGTRLAFTRLSRQPGQRVGGSDLWIAQADGTNAQVFVERDAPSTLIEEPIWVRSGTLYFTERRVEGGNDRFTIARKAEHGSRELVVEDAHAPALTPDEAVLLYLREGKLGTSLWKQPLAGGAACSLIDEAQGQLLGQPRISPDGTRVVFTASGFNESAHGTCAPSPTPVARGEESDPDWPALLGLVPPTAWAHGLPWDAWTINLDGSGLKRVADIKEDEPHATWSPDGKTIAIFGASALYAVDASGGQPQRLVDQGGYAGLDWAP